MARSGRTNFFAWAFASAFASYLAGSSFAEWGAVVVSVALLVFWRTRYGPEALGALAGFAAISLLYGFLLLSATEAPDPAPRLAVGAVLAATIAVLWRHAFARADPQAGPSASSSGRLALATVLAAIPLLITSLFVSIGFGFSCQSDTGHATPGSDHAGYCDLLTKHGELLFLVVAGPAFVDLGAGADGVAQARQRDGDRRGLARGRARDRGARTRLHALGLALGRVVRARLPP